VSFERAELDWDMELWEATPKPWPAHVLRRWLRYVDGCLLRGVRYFVPAWCCPQVVSSAHVGRSPGWRAIQDVSGCKRTEAEALASALACTDPALCVESWRDPYKRAPDPEARIRELEAELAAARTDRRVADGLPTGTGRVAAQEPAFARVPTDGYPTGSRRVPDDRASSPRASTVPLPDSEEKHPEQPGGRPKPIPADMAKLGIRAADVQVIAQYCDSVPDLLMRSKAEISRWKGLGDPGGDRVATACRRAGFPLGCVPDTRPPREVRPGAPPGSRRGSSLLDQIASSAEAEAEPDRFPNAIDAPFEVIPT
jgi:hypothetical protein